VICGHFHIAAMHQDFGPLYVNCGDWVDSFTAVAEAPDGTLRLLSRPAVGAVRAAPVPVAAE
jgi:UDP-2,3-diacylglucosamine pyrophosphatase LpxH